MVNSMLVDNDINVSFFSSTLNAIILQRYLLNI